MIGLDLGSSMGWAWTESGEVNAELSGTWDFTPHRLEGGGMRFLRFRVYLETLLQEAGCCEWSAQASLERELLPREDARMCAVFFEDAMPGTGREHTGNLAREVFGGFVAILTELCERYGVPYQGVKPATLKRRAAGKGNAPKELVLKVAEQVFAFEAKRYTPARPAGSRAPAMPTARLVPRPSEYDRADALWVLQVGLDRLDLTASPPGDPKHGRPRPPGPRRRARR